jgi:hypothetical protein
MLEIGACSLGQARGQLLSPGITQAIGGDDEGFEGGSGEERSC